MPDDKTKVNILHKQISELQDKYAEMEEVALTTRPPEAADEITRLAVALDDARTESMEQKRDLESYRAQLQEERAHPVAMVATPPLATVYLSQD
ncbi:Aste57867_3011 [Aphanomyces stellatus]|uniref:Aste57867_3011 protein n=1 Tax=Aphanomyces stellatus TaxID=120398 RepID=A0A485KBA6_9STRA|nr:hypothetical protein As57867_003002 [Aphanomyces stellatus]VFT80191.1 Aste57867_3011 [Aphanomyces stellatus]